MKSCGFRHAYCKLCRPDIARTRPIVRGYSGGTPDPNHVFPKVTLWEQHVNRLSDPRITPTGAVRQFERRSKEPVTPIRFSNQTLREDYGFTTKMIWEFRQSQRQEKEKKRRAEARTPEQQEKFHRASENRVFRNERIIELFKQGRTIIEVANLEGVTRQRIDQIISLLRKEGIDVKKNRKKTEQEVAIHCAICGQIRAIPESAYVDGVPHFCTKHFKYRRSYKYFLQVPTWFEMTKSEQDNWKYHNDPVRRAQLMKANVRQYFKAKEKPGYKERQKVYTKKYQDKKKAEREALKPKFIPREFKDHD